MKPIPLQLVTIQLENGEHGVFVGLPLIPEHTGSKENQVSELWFSNIKDIPQNMSVDQLIALVQAQLCRCKGEVH
ncbi:MAG: hypothetical protein GC149_03630 [Gammaproteobacteria bacterium]|nr:hypothetical protein [Gammaproteobacteria bacterium]